MVRLLQRTLKITHYEFFSNLRDFWDQVKTLCKKKTQTFFQIELWLALMLTNSCIKKSALPNTPHLPFVVNHDKIFLVVCYGYFT